MLTLLLTITLTPYIPNPNYMPLRYVNYKCITPPLAMTSLGTPNLHSRRQLGLLRDVETEKFRGKKEKKMTVTSEHKKRTGDPAEIS